MPLKGFGEPTKKKRATPGDDRKLDRTHRLREFHRLSGILPTLTPRVKREPVADPEDAGNGAPKTAIQPQPEDLPPEPVHGWDKPVRQRKAE
jgi:hypothetical protein